MFNRVRLKLTACYLLIILVITSTLSFAVYSRASNVYEHELHKVEMRMQAEKSEFAPRMMRFAPTPEDILQARNTFIKQLILINVIVVCIAGVASYILSGWTLKPIQQSVEEQDRFVADAAHELRTPVTALRTSIEVSLMDKKIKAAGRKVLEDNLEDVKCLELLADNLLKLAGADKKDYQQPVNLVSVVERSHKQVKSLAEEKDIDLKMYLPQERDDLYVFGDFVELMELCVILLDNAIKYTNEQGRVSLSLIQKKKQLIVEVQDSGIGIAEAQLPFIFNRFYQADQSRSANRAGYGLGLSVAQKIIEHHHGELKVKSTLGQGSVFSFSLPLLEQ